MPLSRTNRRRNALISSTAALAGASIFLVGFLILIVRLVAPGVLTSVATPVWQLGTAITSGMHGATSVFGNAATLTEERDRLVAETMALSEENRLLRARLADISALSETPAGTRVGVLARPPVTAYDVLVVAAGTKTGVRIGASVYGPGGAPLGIVRDTTPETANIELFSTGGKETAGWVGETRVPITLVGRGGGAFSATLPRESGIAVNDVVYVPGPGALPIGVVTRIDSNPSAPRDTIYIAPYVNIFSLTWVTIAP